MDIAAVDDDNYEAVIAFLKTENQYISEWESLLQNALFKICAMDASNEIQCVFIFEDYPYSLQKEYDFISRSNWTNWMKNHFEIPNESFHTLWLTKWYTTKARKFDVDLLRLVLSSLFISNFEIESVLMAVDAPKDTANKTDENINKDSFTFACQMLFHPLHRLHRNVKSQSNADESLKNVIDLFYCTASKILPAIDIRTASVEDFDDLMPLFQENASYLQHKHGEFFLAELIESSQNDKRLQTLVAMSEGKPVGFVCFTTNIDMMSLRNSFYLQQFDDFEKKINFDAASKGFDRHISIKKEVEIREYAVEEIVKLFENDAVFAEAIAGHIMHFYTSKGWKIEQEELLKQSPENDGEYEEFIKISFELLSDERTAALRKYVNEKIAEYKAKQRNDTPSAIRTDVMIKEKSNFSKLTVDTSLSETVSAPDTDERHKDAMVVLVNLLCISTKYIYATKVFAQTIFNYFPKCQYLLSTTIHDQPAPNYLHYFTSISRKPCVEYPYNLYLLDKNALNATINIRPIDWKLDQDQIRGLINESVQNREAYFKASDDLFTHCFVAVVDYKVIGVVYISDITKHKISEFTTLYDTSSITANVKKLKETNVATLVHMTLNPIFSINVKGILKEIMRQIQIDTFFYEYSPNYNNDCAQNQAPDPQTCVLENFVQIRPKQSVYSVPMNISTYALYAFCREFYAESQEIINHRIVVIANNDDAAYGFIEYLLTQRDLVFNNITLINTRESSKYNENLEDIKTNTLLFKANICSNVNNGNYLQKLCVDNKIEIISDNITELEIERKCVLLKESGVCPFDVLVFANGLGPVQIIPNIKYVPKSKTKKHIKFEKLFEQTKEFKNILLISPEIEGDLHKLHYEMNHNVDASEGNIVIYGEGINTLCMVNCLVTNYKINPKQIIIVNSLSSTSSDVYFKNKKLKTMIDVQLSNLGVRVLENVIPVGFIAQKSKRCQMESIQFIQKENEEINAMIIDENEKDDAAVDDVVSPDVVTLKVCNDTQSGLVYYSLPAQLLILCQNEIDLNTLHITNQDPFVIDGQIVVDNEFKLSNPNIYAIGNIAKFSRKITTSNKTTCSSLMQYANSFDVGRQSAAQIVENILNFNFEQIEKNEKQKAFKVDIEKETCIVGKLHGGYHYFYAYNPRFVLSKKDSDTIKCLESCTENELSSIVFDSNGFLREILYFGKEWKSEWIECSNLINTNLCFLNNIETEFEKDQDGFLNICKLFDTKFYQIMCDDRFRNWMRRIEKMENQKGDLDKIKAEIHDIIQDINNKNEE